MALSIDRLLNYFKVLGEVTYSPCNFSDNDEPDYATIEIVSRAVVVGNLEREVNSYLNETNGFKASLRVISISDLGNERYKYAVEIVPDENVRGEEARILATEQFLYSLPRVIKNLRCKKYHRNI